MDTFVQDLRFALRTLRRSPGFALVAVLTIALGISVNTIVFSMVYGLLARPLPLSDSGRLVHVYQTDQRRGADHIDPSFMNIRDFRTRVNSFESVGAYYEINALVNIGARPQKYQAATVSYDLFRTIGVHPMLGRDFEPSEETYGSNWSSLILSRRIWHDLFHSDPHILGRTIRMNGRTRTIVGVLPGEIRWPEIQDFFIPMGFNPADDHRNSYGVSMIAKLKPGVGEDQARAELKAVMASLAASDPAGSEGIGATLFNFRGDLNHELRPTMMLLQFAVAFVLLIACVNVANLMLARAAGRRREIHLRVALGASRLRVLRQLLTESLMISLLGAVLGVLLAEWGQRLWLSYIPEELPFWMKFNIDAPILAFTAAVAVATSLLFGLTPALHTASDAKLGDALRDGSAQSGVSRGRGRLRSGLVIAEVALSLMLLVGAGLMVRSFVKALSLESSIRPDGVLTGHVLLPIASYPTEENKREFIHTLLHRISALPGVSDAAAVNNLPLSRSDWTQRVLIEGAANPDPHLAPETMYNVCSPGYFQAIGDAFIGGRDFTDADGAKAPRVAIVNQSFAHQLWPGKDALGRRLRFGGDPDSLGPCTVIGVVADVMQHVDRRDMLACVFVPHAQNSTQGMSLVVRSTREMGALTAEVGRILQSQDPDLPLVDVRSMRDSIQFAFWEQRFFMSMMSVFALLALVIAAVGIYGVMAYSVAQRTQEIGVRMALGAAREAVIGMIVGQAMRMTLIGSGIGLIGAFVLTRFMAGLITGVNPGDPPTYVIVAVVLGLSAVLAAWVPAWRATRVDPMVALRCE